MKLFQTIVLAVVLCVTVFAAQGTYYTIFEKPDIDRDHAQKEEILAALLAVNCPECDFGREDVESILNED